MSAMKKAASTYRGEYGYRQGYGFERPLPDYLAELVEAVDAGLRQDDTFSAVAEIDLGHSLPKHRLTLDIAGMTLSTRVGDDEEETRRPASMFSSLGGIRDILAGLVAAGGLPAEVTPNQVHIELQ
ncbi:hypothetical protein [Paracoccus sp. TOH]|uniref:hypothetical protein n=1 Tax=Paracoccus sp. TOH TaxID=1263728 RepID=UPI0025B09470|nr:hypothetical protein [Paracoccus sp. TOH]WJS87222.1 hypothetical protein NBE95_20295 [Paracoccus sp. TOH]